MEKKKSVLICLLVAVAVIILLVLIVSLRQPKGFPVMEYKNQKSKIGTEYKQSDLEEKYGHAIATACGLAMTRLLWLARRIRPLNNHLQLYRRVEWGREGPLRGYIYAIKILRRND